MSGWTVIGIATETVPIVLQLDDFATGLYPRAFIQEEDGTVGPLDTVDLDHVNEGLYLGQYQIPTADKFVIRYKVYTDASRTTESDDYEAAAPGLIIADLADQQAAPIVGSPVDPALC